MASLFENYIYSGTKHGRANGAGSQHSRHVPIAGLLHVTGGPEWVSGAVSSRPASLLTKLGRVDFALSLRGDGNLDNVKSQQCCSIGAPHVGTKLANVPSARGDCSIVRS